jgi:hypothetical protein
MIMEVKDLLDVGSRRWAKNPPWLRAFGAEDHLSAAFRDFLFLYKRLSALNVHSELRQYGERRLSGLMVMSRRGIA